MAPSKFYRVVLLASFAAAAANHRAVAQPAPAPAAPAGTTVRNLIVMLGDGMGAQQVNLLMLYARHAPHSVVPDRMAAIEQLYHDGTVGVMRTECHGALVVDSAAAATQLSTGQWAGSEMVGFDYRGDRAEHLLEAARRAGKSAGLVTETRVTHATPAGFVAHQTNRNMENEIAADIVAARPEVVLGGGLRQFVPQAINDRDSAAYAALMQLTGGAYSATSKRVDNDNLLLDLRRTHKLAFDRRTLSGVAHGPLVGLFADTEMDDALTERAARDNPDRVQPSLEEMATKAIELLDQDPQGFFLMIEGGEIDWAGHNNDAGLLLHELLQFDETVRAVAQWVRQRDDTLLVVLADHETGSFGFSYAGRPLPKPTTLAGDGFRGAPFQPNFNYGSPAALDKLYEQRCSFYSMIAEYEALPAAEQSPERLVDIVNANSTFKIDLDDATRILTRARNRSYAPGHPYLNTPTVPRIDDFEPFFVYGETLKMNLLGRAMAGEQGIVWGSGTHTSTPVLVGALGPPAAHRQFAGMLHATEVGARMRRLLLGGRGEPGPPGQTPVSAAR